MDRCLFITSKKNKHSNAAIKILKKNFLTKVVWSKDFRKENLESEIGNWKGDYLLHYSSYYIIPNKILLRVKKASINFHPAPSKYPGSGGASFALLSNDKNFGAVVHLINNKVDNGLILDEKKFKITKNDNIESLKTKVMFVQFRLFKQTINKILNNNLTALINLRKSNKIPWKGKAKLISSIDKKQLIKIKLDKNKTADIKKMIKATNTKKFPVTLEINKMKFKYTDE